VGASPTGNSYLDSFKRCRRKFYYRHVRGLETKGRSIALDVGTLFHEGLALMVEKNQADTLQHMRDFWSNEMAEGYSDQEPLTLALYLVQSYMDVYDKDPFTSLVEEHEFSYLIDNKYSYTGKCDRIVRGPEDRLYVMEHKTTGFAISMYMRNFYLAPQITGYYIGAVEAVKSMSGEGISGIILNVCQKPRKNKRGYGSPQFGRELFTRTPEQVSEFLSSTAQVFQAIDECAVESAEKGKEAYYRCEHECFSFNRACEYIELCRYGEDEHLIEATFNVNSEGLV